MRARRTAAPGGSGKRGYVEGYTRIVSRGRRTRLCVECGYPSQKHQRCSQCYSYAQLYQALETFGATTSRRAI
jgi:hypothetical protein